MHLILVPQAVVQPNSIGEIESLFKFTQQNKIPMTFRAAVTNGGYYSSNIPCEIGMSEATGKDYTSIVYLVEKASRQGHSDV